ncbi:MAG: MBL fold metallo-hydrolase [Rhizomicrobium sp.]|nr:MBL fold metallo-hydrolase [Rhizomicrobium sp.]
MRWILAFLVVLCAARAESDGFARVSQSLSPHVHLVARPVATNAPYEGNSIVIEQTDGLVVVDAGGAPPAGEAIVRQIKAFSAKPVTFLIYTHYHGDHNLGAGAFLKAWPHLTIVSTAATRRAMTGKPMAYIKTYGQDYAGEIEYAKKQAADPALPHEVRQGWQQLVDVGASIVKGYGALTAYPATLTFDDRIEIPDAQMPVEVRFLGKANTDGDAVVWLPAERVLCSGDIVVSPIPYAAASYPGEWIGVLQKLKEFDFAVLVPGHGEPQSDRAYLDKLIAALTTIRAQVTPLARQGLSPEAIVQKIDTEALKATFTGNDPWLRTLFSSFFLTSIVKNATAEALGQPIVQGTS